MKLMNRGYKNQSGFTLVEAIVTVAIVGLLIVPISTLFADAMARVVETKVKLQTTQLAQLYLENIKMKTNAEFLQFMESNTIKEFTSLTEYSFGFPKLPSGYEAEISFDASTFSTYADPSITERNEFDFEITFDQVTLTNSFTRGFKISDGTDEDIIANSTDMTGTICPIYIYYKKNIDGTAEIYLKKSPTGDKYALAEVTLTDHNFSVADENILKIKLNCKEIDEEASITHIYTDNDYSEPIKIYLDQGTGNKVSIEYDVDDHTTSFGNKTDIVSLTPLVDDLIAQTIYKITVKITGPEQFVVETNTGKQRIVSELTTTKIDK